jgi:hypothetical protein
MLNFLVGMAIGSLCLLLYSHCAYKQAQAQLSQIWERFKVIRTEETESEGEEKGEGN